jgi:NDP-sugar pyrophosphorylase family protein
MRAETKNIDVLILCGGQGKRLRRISGITPKPLVKVVGKPFLDILIDFLIYHGFRRIFLGIGYNAQAFKRYYQCKKNKNVEIILIEEKSPLGTGGALKHARSFIKSSPFLALNGDSFCPFDPKELLSFHKKNKSLVTMLLHKVSDGKDYGKIVMDKYFRINNFSEKNRKAKKCFVNAGVYVFDKKIFSLMPIGSEFSLEYDFFPSLTAKRIFGYPNKGYFIDIGTPRRLKKARQLFSRINREPPI